MGHLGLLSLDLSGVDGGGKVLRGYLANYYPTGRVGYQFKTRDEEIKSGLFEKAV